MRGATLGNELCYLTATEAIASFKKKTLSPVELMQAVIQRAEEVQPKVNAFTYTFYERALGQAKQAEGKYRSGQPTGPLEGIPLVIKDLHPIKGELTTLGSRTHVGIRDEFTAAHIERLMAAGAIIHARTTTPEFAHAGHCHSPLWGVTRNPWNLEYTTGGSSGGAGAAVAAGMTTIADGGDGGGSIRIPACLCGIFGYKPPFGRTPSGILPFVHQTFLHFGPMTHSVADGILMQNVMSGFSLTDIMSLREKLVIPARLKPIRGWRVAHSMDLGCFEVDHEVRKNTLEALQVFRDLGCQIQEVKPGWNCVAVYKAWLTHWQALFATLCGPLLPEHRHEMDPFAVKLIEQGLELRAVEDIAIQVVIDQMYRGFGPMIEDYDIFVCPTVASNHIKATHANDDPNFTINGKPCDAYLSWAMTYPFNLLSQCPVASVPSGFASNGVPIGIQIVGRAFDDVRVFRAAKAYEAAKPWRGKRPAL